MNTRSIGHNALYQSAAKIILVHVLLGLTLQLFGQGWAGLRSAIPNVV